MKHAASLCKSISAILVNFMRTNTHNPLRMFDRLILLKRVIVAQPEILNVYSCSFLIATIVMRIMMGFLTRSYVLAPYYHRGRFIYFCDN